MANYQEGDYVPGRGILMPDGTYRATKPGDMGDTTGDAVIDSTQTKATAKTGKTGITPKNLDEIWSQAAKTGITRQQFDQLNPTQQATVATLGESASSLYAYGSTGVTVNDALKAAANDPAITTKYADALALDNTAFTDGLNNIRLAVSNESMQNKMQFEKDRKALAEANAAAGTAYSGFRQQAEKNLADTEAGIVTSSRARAKQQLDQLTQSFAAKYGSAATPVASLDFNSTPDTNISGLYNPTGIQTETLAGTTSALTGSVANQKQTEINNKAASLYQTGQLPKL